MKHAENNVIQCMYLESFECHLTFEAIHLDSLNKLKTVFDSEIRERFGINLRTVQKI